MIFEPIFLHFYCKDEYLPDLNLFSIDTPEETINTLKKILYESYTNSKDGLFQEHSPLTKEQRRELKFFIEDEDLFKRNLPNPSIKDYQLALVAKWENQIIRIIDKAKTSKGKSDAKKVQDWIDQQTDIVLEKVTKPKTIKYKKFDDYLSEEAKALNLTAKIRPRYANLKKPEKYYYLIYALKTCKYFIPEPNDCNVSLLHTILIKTFGKIGSRQAFGDGIHKLFDNRDEKELITKYAEEIKSLLK